MCMNFQPLLVSGVTVVQYVSRFRQRIPLSFLAYASQLTNNVNAFGWHVLRNRVLSYSQEFGVAAAVELSNCNFWPTFYKILLVVAQVKSQPTYPLLPEFQPGKGHHSLLANVHVQTCVYNCIRVLFFIFWFRSCSRVSTTCRVCGPELRVEWQLPACKRGREVLWEVRLLLGPWYGCVLSDFLLKKSWSHHVN